MPPRIANWTEAPEYTGRQNGSIRKRTIYQQADRDVTWREESPKSSSAIGETNTLPVTWVKRRPPVCLLKTKQKRALFIWMHLMALESLNYFLLVPVNIHSSGGQWRSIINLAYNPVMISKRRVWSLYKKHEGKCERGQGTAGSWTWFLSQHSEVPTMHMLYVLLSTVFGFRKGGRGQTHSLSKGMDVLLLLFCTMLAWFLKDIRIMAGANLQGSPSTCMGMDL